MKLFKKNTILISFILAISIFFSVLFIGIVNGNSILSPTDTDNTYLNTCFSDIVTSSTLNTRRITQDSSLLPKYKTNNYVFNGFGGLFALITSFYNHRFYSVFSAVDSANILGVLHSHTIILDYIHHQDGKK